MKLDKNWVVAARSRRADPCLAAAVLKTERKKQSPVGFVTQLTNRSLHGFEAQTKKLSQWFCGPNHQTGAASFEAQIEKPLTLILRFN
jgi:hypothetical protein